MARIRPNNKKAAVTDRIASGGGAVSALLKLGQERTKLAKEGLATNQAMVKVYADTAKFSAKQAEFERQVAIHRTGHINALKDLHKLQRQIDKETDASKKSQLRSEYAAKRVVLDTIKEEMDKKVNAIKFAASEEMAAMKKIVNERADLMRKAEDSARRNATETAEVFGDGLKEAFNDISSADLRPLARKLAEMFSRAAIRKQAVAAETGGAANAGSMMASLGKALGAIAAITAVVAGLVAVFKLFSDADKAVKEFNRSVLTGIGSGTLGRNVGDFTKKLDSLREMFGKNASWLNEMGIKAEEAVGVFHALQEGVDGLGLSLERLTSGYRDGNKGLQDYVQTAVDYSRTFGVSFDEMGSKFASVTEDMGLGLESIKEEFSSINTVAMESGFNVKRFFGQVLAATSGMTMYNLRIQDTAVLMGNLTKTLGQARAASLFGQLKGEQSGKGTLERLGDVVKMGGAGQAEARRLAQSDAVNQARNFLDVLNKTGNGDGKRDKLIAALGDLKDVMDDPEAFARALGNADQKVLDTIARRLRNVDQGQANVFGATSVVSGAFDLSNSLGALTNAMQALSPTATMLNMMKKGSVITGGRSLGELNDKQDMFILAALEANFNLTHEQMVALQTMDRSMNSLIDETTATLSEISKSSDADAMRLAKEFNDRNLSAGISLMQDSEGRYGKYRTHMKADGGLNIEETLADRIGDSIDDFKLAVNTAGIAKDVEDVTTKDQEIAMATRDATFAMSDNIANINDSLLMSLNETASNILDTLSGWYNWVLGKDSKEDIAATSSAANFTISAASSMVQDYISPAHAKLVQARKNAERTLKGYESLSDSEKLRQGVTDAKIRHLRSKLESAGRSLENNNPTLLRSEGYALTREVRGAKSVAEASAVNLKAVDVLSKVGLGFENLKYQQESLAEALGRFGGDVKEGVKDGIKEAKPPNVPVAGLPMAPPANDLLLQMGSGGVKFAQRIDNQDVGVFAKKGGAIDKAGLGAQARGGVIHNHFYQDQRAIFMSMKKLMKVLGQP